MVALSAFIFRGGFLDDSEGKAVTLMEELKDEVRAAIDSPVMLQASIRRNANRFACLSDGGSVCRKKGGQFILYRTVEEAGIEPISQIPESRGVSLAKSGCNTFPSQECPIRVETTWRVDGNLKGCSNQRKLWLVARIVLNTGTLFLDWKEDYKKSVKVQLNARALCKCQGKRYANGECMVDGNSIQLAKFPRDIIDERDPREDERTLASEPECDEDVVFRGDSFPISDINESGIGYIELESDNEECATQDTYRFRCVKGKSRGRTPVATWVYLGVTKGRCGPTEAEAALQDQLDRDPATEEELFDEEIPEGEYLEEQGESNEF